MIIRNNKNASFASRSVGSSRTALIKSLENLSSGYVINSAADDAAGLAISEKIRRQITGLDQAYQNSKDGATLIQVGEGALNEIHSMLNRAAALAGQSANGTYDNELDRKGLQAELDQLCADIDRIAKGTNFNGIKLFQDKGLKYEQAKIIPTTAAQAAEVNRASAWMPQVQTTARRALDDLLEDQEKSDLNIVYVEQTGALVTATPTGQGNNTLGMDKNITVKNPDGTTTTRKLSDILKEEIVPNTVKQVMDHYPAFSYLNGSTIGIGLEYYTKTGNPQMANALAYVTIGYVKNAEQMNYADYTLGVNVDTIPTTLTRDDLVELEATISHEMIHAFMDEATTAGMVGFDPTDSTFKDAAKFPSWFVEGMAQTASGSGNWVHPRSGSGLQIDEKSTDAAIRSQINNHKLGTDDSGADYGTGYLACMYLGWKIASGGDSSTEVNASNISRGLTSLMNDVIGGKSLDSAIRDLTSSTYTSTSDFQTKFNAAGTDIPGFVHNLMVARGAGRGGLISGDLTDKDLIPDDAIPGVGLFALDTEHKKVQNIYPSGYPVLSGGTVSGDNTKVPTDFKPAVTAKEYGDFIVHGNLPDDGSGGMTGIEWNDTTKTLTVTTGGDIKISMKNPTSGQPHKLELKGEGKVTLDGVNADSLKVDNTTKTEVSYEGKNAIKEITVSGGTAADFQGKGQLTVGTFTNTGTVNFNGGAVIVGAGGTGNIDGTVNINGASVAATITNAPKAPDGTTDLKTIDVDWSKLAPLTNIASITVDGVKADALLDNNDPGKLWLDPAKNHRVSFTDASGVSKTLVAEVDAAGNFTWAPPTKPFVVTGGVEDTDYHYESDGITLVIDTKNVTSITGGNITDASGTNLQGRIKIGNNVGALNLTLDGVDCSQNTVGSGFDLGEGNEVTLTLADGKENKFTGAASYAGISVGAGTKLTIDGNTGKLVATAGAGAAGIGRNAMTAATNKLDKTSTIKIKGGDITATGKTYGAGIGAGNYNDIGDITITGGDIHATGGDQGGAGIGGANYADCGNIKINEDSGKTTITAISEGHGAGIGGGWWDTINGEITISAGTITAESKYHGTGIGAGCQGGSTGYHSESGKITITGTAVIEKAQGGNSGAGIGASSNGTCVNIEISGNATVKEARGGNNGAGIGSGANSKAGKITIETDGIVNAYGGTNSVGIGAGYGGSECEEIEIKKGTVKAEGSTDATGIGSGRNSHSGNITIGDENHLDNKVIVTAQGGMTHNGGNIMSYTDSSHTKPGTVKIVGNGTSVRPGNEGEGLYSTSGVVGQDNQPIFAYPVYLFHTDSNTGENNTLNAGVGMNAQDGTKILPLDKNKVDLNSIIATIKNKAKS